MLWTLTQIGMGLGCLWVSNFLVPKPREPDMKVMNPKSSVTIRRVTEHDYFDPDTGLRVSSMQAGLETPREARERVIEAVMTRTQPFPQRHSCPGCGAPRLGACDYCGAP